MKIFKSILLVGLALNISPVYSKVGFFDHLNVRLPSINIPTTSSNSAPIVRGVNGQQTSIPLPANYLDITVSDGDTISFNYGGSRVRVRLVGIDAPEKAQVYGSQSREGLRQCISGGKGLVSYNKKDQYGRVLGQVIVNGVNCNVRQVINGNAWYYEQFSNEVPLAMGSQLSQAQANARARRIGLWQNPSPQQPWEWRKLNK